MSKAFDEFLESYSPDVRELAARARALILDALPEVSEHVYPAMRVVRYGLDGGRMAGLVCYIAPLKAGVNLGFMRGTSLADPHKLLAGTGKNLRHVKLRRAEDAANPALRALLVAARGAQ